MKQASAIIALAAAISVAGRAAALDVVVLQTGKELRGEVLGRTTAEVRLNLLPGQVTLPAATVREIRTEDNPRWYLERIRGRNPIAAAAILDSAVRSGCASSEIRAKFVQSSVKSAEKLLVEELPALSARCCRQALALQPDDAGAKLLLNRAEAALRRTESEAAALQTELKRNPANDYAAFLLGEAWRKLGRTDQAFAQYRRIIAGKLPFDGGPGQIDELRQLIRSHLQVDDAPAADKPAAPLPEETRKVSLPGIEIVFHDPALRQTLAEEVPASYNRVAEQLGMKAAPNCTIRILRTRAEFVAATGNEHGDGFTSGSTVWTHHGAPGLLDNVIPHELAHVILGASFGRLPAWLSEGLAVRQETSAGVYWGILRAGRRLPLRELLADVSRPGKEENNRFYASAYSFVDMLVEDGGMERIGRLIAALKSSPAEQALRTVYEARNLGELEERWAQYLQN